MVEREPRHAPFKMEWRATLTKKQFKRNHYKHRKLQKLDLVEKQRKCRSLLVHFFFN